MAAKGMQQKLAPQEAERTGQLAPPPAPVQTKALLTPSAGKCKPALGLKRQLAAGPKLATPSAGKCQPALGLKHKLAGPKLAEQGSAPNLHCTQLQAQGHGKRAAYA